MMPRVLPRVGSRVAAWGCTVGLSSGRAGVGRDLATVSVISPEQKRRLLAGAIVLLAVALLGLAAKAKTRGYSAGPGSASHFSTSVKIAENAHPLRTLLAVPQVESPAHYPVVISYVMPLVSEPVVQISSEPLTGLRPLRAPPAFPSLLL